jgi:hypothetical protein
LEEIQSGHWQGKGQPDDVRIAALSMQELGILRFCTGYVDNNQARYCYQDNRDKFANIKGLNYYSGAEGMLPGTCKT